MQRIAIRFPHAAPSVEFVLAELARRSGIDSSTFTDAIDGTLVENDDFNCWFYIKREANSIYIKCEVGQTGFLFWALIAMLRDLGAEYPGAIPEYADKQWASLAETHPEFKHGLSE